MPTEGELLYYEAIGEEGVAHALNKPFSDPDCDLLLMQVGSILSVLPPAPARILECGCGTGWLTRLLAARGYRCTGIDVAPAAIALAQRQPPVTSGSVRYRVQDAESMSFQDEFDAVLFFDSLHHSLDEAKAIQGAFRALAPGGICIASEPGRGHAKQSREVVARFGVTEKDMPAGLIIRLARAAGFQRAEVFPRMDELGLALIKKPEPRRWLQRLMRPVWLLNLLYGVLRTLAARARRDNGLVVLHKAAAAPARTAA